MAVQKFTVSRDDGIYQSWPDVALTDGGKLICIFTQCKHHGDREGSHLVMCESTDRGRSWSERRVFTGFTTAENHWNCPRIKRLSDGSLVVTADKAQKDNNAGSAVYYWKGDPEGKNWEGPFPTPAVGIVPDRLFEAENGRWIIACHKLMNSKRDVSIWYSDDRGKSWSERVAIVEDGDLKLCEPSLIQVKNTDTIVCLMRENSGLGYDCYKAISDDCGKSWRGVFNMPIPGCHRPVAGYLDDGSVMVTYRFMQGGSGWLGKWTQNMFAAFTDTESLLAEKRGDQWTRIMPLDYDRSPVSDLGYTGWVQFPDGEIYVVNYIADDAPCPYIRGYSFYMSDVLL